MRSSWSEPYLWVHLAGIAAVPIFLELCLVGLAASRTVLPAGVVFLVVAIVGISPILWMQWYRPFSIFSLVALALKPSELTETQRQILRRFKTPVAQAVAVIVAILAFLILWQLNQWVPFHAPILKLPGGWFGGLLLAAVAFLLSNLFLQVPASVLTVLLTPERQITAAEPYPVAQIPTDFTLIGLQVKQILPPIALSATPAAPPASAPPVSEPVAVGASNLPQPEVAEVVQPEPSELEQLAPEPEVMEPEATAPEAPELKTSEPEVIEPEVTEPEASEPETIESELHQPETEVTSEAITPEPTLETVQPETEPEISESENLEPESFEFESLEAEAEIIAEPDSAAEPVEVEPIFPPVEEVSVKQEPPVLEEVTSVERQIPQVTDTVVTVNLPTEETSSAESKDSIEDKAIEDGEDAASKVSPPTVTDTIVTIDPP